MSRRFRSPEDCPNVETHTAHPTQYNAWNEWAEKMHRTHEQTLCPTCGFWVIWEPLDSRETLTP